MIRIGKPIVVPPVMIFLDTSAGTSSPCLGCGQAQCGAWMIKTLERLIMGGNRFSVAVRGSAAGRVHAEAVGEVGQQEQSGDRAERTRGDPTEGVPDAQSSREAAHGLIVTYELRQQAHLR
jgi:hypothetical protein